MIKFFFFLGFYSWIVRNLEQETASEKLGSYLMVEV